MNKVIALIGTANSGKTTLFNALTGKYQKTGNRAGVTTDIATEKHKKQNDLLIVDLPGIYSLKANSKDESVVLSYLKKTPPSVIINVVDGTNLERNLFLTTQLKELSIPMVIAVNCCDELKKNGVTLNESKLEELFGAPVVPISALKKTNLDKLIKVALTTITTLVDKKFAPNLTIEERYNFIEKNIDKIISARTIKNQIFTDKIDNILTHKIWGFPIFFLVITAVYYLSCTVGGFLGGEISNAIDILSTVIFKSLNQRGFTGWFISLLCDGIIRGFGAVLGFLPQIIILFLMLSLIEQSGYSSRIAFILDRVFKCFGLSGKSLIPMILSCGCTVTGLMATRTIESKSERRLTLFLAPFMPCGAKMAVFSWFATVFFGGSALIATSMYFMGIFTALFLGAILKNFKAFKQEYSPFILEMPTLKIPPVKEVVLTLLDKVKEFILKAGMLVFVLSVALWFLSNFGVYGYQQGQLKNSYLYLIGNVFKYIFYPLGFCSPETAVAILSGAFAKEGVVETLLLLSSEPTKLFSSRLTAYSFMAFILLSPPCTASLAVAFKELNGKKWFFSMIIFQFITAYTVSALINFSGIIFGGVTGLLLSVILGIIIMAITVVFIVKLKKKGCKGCKAGKKCKKRCTI